MSRERSWRVVTAAAAARDLERLPEKIATAILDLYPAIAENPYRLGKPLHLELEGQHAARRGPYRVLYEIDEAERIVRVVAIGHRSDVYRPR